MADSYLCRDCRKTVTATKNGRYRTHTDGEGNRCGMSSEPVPGDLIGQGPEPAGTPADVPVEGKDFATCPQCRRKVTLTRLGYFPPHTDKLHGGEQCLTTGVRAFHARATEDVPLPGDRAPKPGSDRPKVSAQMEVEDRAALPASTVPAGTTPPAEAAAPASADVSDPNLPATVNLAAHPMDSLPTDSEALEALKAFESAPADVPSGASTETNSPGSATTSKPSEAPSAGTSPNPTGTVSEGPFQLGRKISELFRQPDSPFLQPVAYEGPVKPEVMDGLAAELATRIKETFYAYDNRKTADNRSAQTTLGPSEIGTPCDRRLAMALMGIPAVNPGGDGWAAFVGTMGHVGMGEMLQFADAGTGRYAVELRLNLPSPYVPRGTTDALDRRDGTVIDWKFMGAYSLKKFKLEGPSPTYRIQAHVYGLGAVLAGEVVRNVAVVGLPRAGGSLDDMHVWVEKFDRKLAEAALARVDAIATGVKIALEPMHPDGAWSAATPMEVAKTFPVADDCRFCSYYLKGDTFMGKGCPGVKRASS